MKIGRLHFALILMTWMGTGALAGTVAGMHLDLEMTGREYEALLAQLAKTNHGLFIKANDPLKDILTLGKRNLEWLDVINAHRGQADKLELSTVDSQVGIPIEKPRESNRTIIGIQFNQLKDTLPKDVAAVLFATTPLTDTVPVDDKTFLAAIREVDRVYQMASRWLLQEPNLIQYASFSNEDIRGYYFLNKEEDLDKKLTTWSDQPDGVRNRLTPLLVNICHNTSGSVKTCSDLLAKSIDTNKNAKVFYDKYVDGARKHYQSFFAIRNPRSDAVYSANKPNSFVLPFRKPEKLDVENWLRDNIQDEWRLKAFQLMLNFVTPGTTSPYVTFVAGATPNVNGLGGNRITMDANRNIQEYITRWTIRHEFGHVIGYPDCYVEYYDADRKVMINYQLDITNLMCSRRGHIQEQHITAMQKAYWKKQ